MIDDHYLKKDLWSIHEASYLLNGFNPNDKPRKRSRSYKEKIKRTYELIHSSITAKSLKYFCINGGGQYLFKPMNIIEWAKSKQLELPKQLLELFGDQAKVEAINQAISEITRETEPASQVMRKIETLNSSSYLASTDKYGTNDKEDVAVKTFIQSVVTAYPNAREIREILTAVQLSQLQTLELMAANLLEKGINGKQAYKTIYKDLKKELNSYVSNKSSVLNA